MDKEVRAVFIGAVVSMLLSSIALRNHPTECVVKFAHEREVHVMIGHIPDD